MKLHRFYKITVWETHIGPKPFSIRRLFKELFQIPYERESKSVEEHLSAQLRFVVIHPNHVRFLIPLYQQLQAEKISFDIVAYSEGVGESLRKAGIEYTRWEHSIRLIDYYVAAFTQLTYLVFLRPYALISPSMKFKLRAIAKFYKSVHLLEAYTKRELLGRGAKKIVLFKAEGFQARTILAIAQGNSGVQTFAVQHGLIDTSIQFSKLWVDRYLVWSEFFKERLQKANAGCQVEIAGNPVFDDLFSSKRHKPESNTPVIYALPNSGNSHTNLRQVQLLVEAVVHLAHLQPNFSIVLKPHPGDVNEYVSTKARQLKPPSNLRLIDRNDPLELQEADIAIINNSAAGMEAAVLGVPLVVMADQVQNIMVPQYLREGIANFASSSDELAQQIEEIFENITKYQGNCARFVNKYLSNHGMAAKSIVNELLC